MRKFWLILGFVVLAGLFYQLGVRNGRVAGSDDAAMPTRNVPADVSYRTLPAEAAAVIQAIADGGPYDYPRDGMTFQNRERILPQQDRGYYREFTVRTPGSKDRGARRIVTGGRPVTEIYYTGDHYRSFVRITDAEELGH